jgi:hypothetical protein
MTAEHTHINHSLSLSTCTISHATVPMPISKPIPTIPTFQKGAAKSEKKSTQHYAHSTRPPSCHKLLLLTTHTWKKYLIITPWTITIWTPRFAHLHLAHFTFFLFSLLPTHPPFQSFCIGEIQCQIKFLCVWSFKRVHVFVLQFFFSIVSLG